jgi:tetratricopeptide (TPR) repeat protein
MSSIISGYNYDIFISYRQKDNKYDGWVTNFVDNLKGELESTFKEEISVYFDINPHDGLLETHDVDESLKGKLKCLVFIPIISRTYCDPKSFAWEHEFKAFVELASKDQFGLKVKLPNGNVASRVLPLRIHDLDNEDIKMYESVLGGVLRGIEFVYKEAGIDKPLAPDDDHIKNLNNTKYRIQIIKVAHAIKEILLGMKTGPTSRVNEGKANGSSQEILHVEGTVGSKKPVNVVRIKFIIYTSLIGLLLLAVIINYPRIFKRDTLERLRASGERVSVAVMPFQNLTDDTIWNVWQSGIQDIIVANLSNSPEELKVRQIESINDMILAKGYANYATITPAVARNISKKLEADIFVHGSIKQEGNTIRLSAQLIDSKTEDVFKSFQIDGVNNNILNIADSLTLALKNFLIISKIEKGAPPEYWNLSNTYSPEAFKLFISGQSAFFKNDFGTASKLFSQALSIDSNFTDAALRLSYSYLNLAIMSADRSLLNNAKKYCLKLYKRRGQMPLELKILINRLYAIFFETPNEEIQYLNQLKELNDQSPSIHFDLGVAYTNLYQYSSAVSEFEKSLEIYKKWEQKPVRDEYYVYLGNAYHKTGQYKKESKLYSKAERDFPDDPLLIQRQAVLSLSKGDTVEGNTYIKDFISLSEKRAVPEALIMANLAMVYNDAGILDKSEKLFRELLSLYPENPDWMNMLAWMLIDSDRNIDEGLEIIDKALELSPYNSDMLDTKAWGLYKQGKYKKALGLLQKADSLKPFYNQDLHLHLEASKKAVASQLN